jgi:hypothetical protein
MLYSGKCFRLQERQFVTPGIECVGDSQPPLLCSINSLARRIDGTGVPVPSSVIFILSPWFSLELSRVIQFPRFCLPDS